MYLWRTSLVNRFFQYSDGAMGFNNPVLLLFKEVMLLSPKWNGSNEAVAGFMPNIDYIVSIGTGMMDGLSAPIGSAKSGIRRFVETVKLAIELVTDFENAHHQMQMLANACGNIPYFRFNPPLPERVPLDIRTKTELNKLIEITEAYLGNHEINIPEQIERLKTLINDK